MGRRWPPTPRGWSTTWWSTTSRPLPWPAGISPFPLNAWEPPPTRTVPISGPVGSTRCWPSSRPTPGARTRSAPFWKHSSMTAPSSRSSRGFGRSIITALAHLGGRSVALVANDPSVMAGTVDSAAADKAAHFLEVAGAFGLPCIFLADNPGVLAGTRAEEQGILRHAARMFSVQHRLAVPKLHVTLRKAFGFGSSIMAMNPFDGQTITLAFPSITLGALPASSEGSAIADPEERKRVAAEQAKASVTAGSRLAYDDVIDPRDLRNALLAGLTLARGESPILASLLSGGVLP